MFHILLALADKERHGYEIMQEVQERTEGAVRLGPGTLYGSIKRMLSDGLVEESEERPDPELDDAGNYFQAHVPFELPSSTAAEERLRWLTFDEKPGAEKLYFVFTREPLNAVPIEDDLITFCRDNGRQCPWNPGTDVWARIQKNGMAVDNSWSAAAKKYLEFYDEVLAL